MYNIKKHIEKTEKALTELRRVSELECDDSNLRNELVRQINWTHYNELLDAIKITKQYNT